MERMSILLKDYATKRQSLTVTVFVLGIVAMVTYLSLGIYLMAKGQLQGSETAFGFLVFAFLGFGGGLYYKKRVRLSASGVEFSEDENIKE